mmetsp:Transcript_87775/g.284147  ORF Transcript_87775/g.284147 Transcript_87775/m.284147 type:complete len:155 (-) Transcript_87775:22-486(-)
MPTRKASEGARTTTRPTRKASESARATTAPKSSNEQVGARGVEWRSSTRPVEERDGDEDVPGPEARHEGEEDDPVPEAHHEGEAQDQRQQLYGLPGRPPSGATMAEAGRRRGRGGRSEGRRGAGREGRASQDHHGDGHATLAPRSRPRQARSQP